LQKFTITIDVLHASAFEITTAGLQCARVYIVDILDNDLYGAARQIDTGVVIYPFAQDGCEDPWLLLDRSNVKARLLSDGFVPGEEIVLRGY
jgi:hypothetical protein